MTLLLTYLLALSLSVEELPCGFLDTTMILLISEFLNDISVLKLNLGLAVDILKEAQHLAARRQCGSGWLFFACMQAL